MTAPDIDTLIRFAHESHAVLADQDARGSLRQLAADFLRQHPLAAGLAAVERMTQAERAA